MIFPTKNTCCLAALKNIVITQNNTEEITEFETTPCPPDTFNLNWEQYSGNKPFDLKPATTNELQKL